MGWCKTKRLILNKPYLIDPYRQISLQEAKQIWLKTGYPSDEELLNRACLIAGKTQAEWSFLFDRKKYSKQTLFVKLKNITLFKRPLIAVFTIILALIALLTFTVPGRAFANNIYNAISKIIENILYIRPEDTSFLDNAPILRQDIPSLENRRSDAFKFTELRKASEYVGRDLVFLNNADYRITDITVKESPVSGIMLKLVYSNDNGINIYIDNKWVSEHSDWAFNINIEGSEYKKIETSSGFIIEGMVTEDNLYSGFSIINDNSISISIDKNGNVVGWETIEGILEDLELYK